MPEAKPHLQLYSVMSRFIRGIQTMDRNEKMCYGVTLSQWYIIDTLLREKLITMNELSNELGLATSTLTRTIDILVRDDIVIRQLNPNDRRKVCVELTENGQELAQKLKICSEEFWQKIYDLLPEEKKTQVLEDVQLLVNTLEGANGLCCPRP